MTSKIFKVEDKLGIHVRVACEILKVAKEQDCKLFARKVDGRQEKSPKAFEEIKFPLSLVAMQARFGEEVEFVADGSDAEVEAGLLEKIGDILINPIVY